MELLEPSAREEVPDIYVNAVRIGAGLYDFTLELGIQDMPNTTSSERPPTRTLARVRMSPQHALILAKLLDKNVAEYEQKVGQIHIPPEVFTELGLAEEG